MDKTKHTSGPYIEQEANVELIACSKKLLIAIKQLYNLAESMGMIMTSDQWTENFRSEFNPVMENAESLLKKLTK